MYKNRAGNYEWLNDEYGKVLKIEYEEPSGSGNWRNYDDKTWAIHCRAISHNLSNLVKDHVETFVGPKRTISLRFTFNKNGKIYTRSPDKHFYELEYEYFLKNGNGECD